jgi:hypothetical protein
VHSTPFLVFIDTSGLAAGSEAVIAFDLLNSDSTVSHSVQITSFDSDGSLLVCPAPDTCAPPNASPDVQPVGADVSGTLPGTVTIRDTDVGGFAVNPITYYQNVILGSFISFAFEMLGDAAPGDPPDGFDAALLDAQTGLPLVGENGILFLFSAGEGCESGAPDIVRCLAVASVPEPGTYALVALALTLLAWRLRARRRGPC